MCIKAKGSIFALCTAVDCRELSHPFFFSPEASLMANAIRIHTFLIRDKIVCLDMGPFWFKLLSYCIKKIDTMFWVFFLNFETLLN